MPECVFRQQSAVVAIVSERVRTRTDQRHVAEQNVEELRQLIDTGGPQYRAEPADAWIMLCRLGHVVAVFHHRHGAEFEDQEPFGVEPAPLLPEKHRPGRVELDCQRRQQQQRQQQHQRDAGGRDVEHALCELLRFRKRCPLDADCERTTDREAGVHDQIANLLIGQKLNRQR